MAQREWFEMVGHRVQVRAMPTSILLHLYRENINDFMNGEARDPSVTQNNLRDYYDELRTRGLL